MYVQRLKFYFFVGTIIFNQFSVNKQIRFHKNYSQMNTKQFGIGQMRNLNMAGICGVYKT